MSSLYALLSNRSFDTDAQVRPCASRTSDLCAGQVRRQAAEGNSSASFAILFHTPVSPVKNTQTIVLALKPLLGQWGLISFDLETQQTGDRRPAWGPNPVGRLVILPSAFMIVVLTAADCPQPLTDDLKAAACKQTIAYTGPIEVEGDLMKTTLDVSWNATWTNNVQGGTCV